MEKTPIENYGNPKGKGKGNMIICLIINLILLALAITFIALYAHEKDKNKKKDSNNNNNSTNPETEPLSLWSDFDDDGPKKILLNYIKKITDENGVDYVPKEDRIAVFDFDGTLFQETDPTYCDHKLYMYRVFNDTNYKDKATEKQKEVANTIKEYADMGKLPPLDIENG